MTIGSIHIPTQARTDAEVARQKEQEAVAAFLEAAAHAEQAAEAHARDVVLARLHKNHEDA